MLVWWAGDGRAYRGTLQLESDFDVSGKLTVRYDDGDVRQYPVATLMVRVYACGSACVCGRVCLPCVWACVGAPSWRGIH